MGTRLLERISALVPLGLTLALGLLAAGCGDVASIPGPSTANPLDAEEDALLSALNTFRGTAGISVPVTICATLNVSATLHSDDMRDQGYLSDKGQDGSTPRTRGCAAGYKPACTDGVSMAEVVASGLVNGKDTFPQWTKDESTKSILVNPALTFVGVGRAVGGDVPVWTLDLASKDDPACH